MRLSIILSIAIFLSACNKNDQDPGSQTPGLIEGYLKKNPDMTITKTSESTIPYNNNFATSRGYHFNPLKDIRVTDIGGRIAETGTFKIRICNIDNGWSKGEGWVDVLVDSIKITNTSVFQYKKVDQEVILLTGHKYLISYFNKSHDSVFDAGTGYLPGYLQLPLTIQDVEIERIYYSYDQIIIGGFQTVEEGFTNGLGIFRGLVDMKYERVD